MIIRHTRLSPPLPTALAATQHLALARAALRALDSGAIAVEAGAEAVPAAAVETTVPDEHLIVLSAAVLRVVDDIVNAQGSLDAAWFDSALRTVAADLLQPSSDTAYAQQACYAEFVFVVVLAVGVAAWHDSLALPRPPLVLASTAGEPTRRGALDHARKVTLTPGQNFLPWSEW